MVTLIITLSILWIFTIITITLISKRDKATIIGFVLGMILLSIITVVVNIYTLYTSKPEEQPELVSENKVISDNRTWDITLPYTYDTPIADLSNEEVFDYVYPSCLHIARERNVPGPSEVVESSFNENTQCQHYFIASLFGNQIFEVESDDKVVKIRYYGTYKHEGSLGLAYNMDVDSSTNIDAIENKLRSMGLTYNCYKIKSISGDEVTVYAYQTDYKDMHTFNVPSLKSYAYHR